MHASYDVCPPCTQPKTQLVILIATYCIAIGDVSGEQTNALSSTTELHALLQQERQKVAALMGKCHILSAIASVQHVCCV